MAAGARKEGADAAAEVLVAEEDEDDEKQDDAEKEPQQPERESFGDAGTGWVWRVASTPPLCTGRAADNKKGKWDVSVFHPSRHSCLSIFNAEKQKRPHF